MKKTGYLTFLYTPIQNKEDAEIILSDMSLFWYIISIVLILVFLIITISTKEEISLLFFIILFSAGYLLSHRKSRVLSSFILVYSLALNGVAIWFFNRSTIADFTNGLSPTVANPHFIATVSFYLSFSLIIVLLTLCSWAACRSFMATFIYHKEIGSQIFWRNVFLLCGLVIIVPYFVIMPYLFSEIPWQHVRYGDTYEYFKVNLFFRNGAQLISIIFFIVLTKYLPLVRWTSENFQNNRLYSLYKPILDEKDAEKVLSDLSMFLYVLGIIFAIYSVIFSINLPKTMGYYYFYCTAHFINPIIFLFAGYFLPRRKSRVLSLVTLIILIYMSAISIWYFLFIKPPSFGLWSAKILIDFIVLLIPFFIIFCTWAAFRITMATFVYHRHYSQPKKIS